MESNYGPSPLIAFAEVVRRSHLAHELKTKLNKRMFICKPQSEGRVIDFQPIITEDLKWVPMVNTDYMCSIFCIPSHLIK